jgi:hypothetical protein
MTTYETIMAGMPVELNNTSAAALYDTIARNIAISIDNTKTELDNTKIIIQDIIGLQRYGRSGNYVYKALAFQYGDDLIEDTATHEYYYATIDTTKQIIKQAAFQIDTSGGGQILTMKVAAYDNTNKLRKLTTDEKNSFDGYFLQFEIPGLPIYKSSTDPNIFDFTAIVTYYGTYDRNKVINGVTSSLYTFRDSFKFNGTLYTNDLEDYLKINVPGIRNVSLLSTMIDNVVYVEEINLLSGYFDYVSDILDKITYNAI